MTTALTISDDIDQFKTGVDTLLQKRDYFIQKILPKLEENRDYYTIKGRKSLGKAGAEKLAAIYSLVATFEKDIETIESFSGVEGLVAFVCTLTRMGEVVGQGRGAATLRDNGDDPNKCIKMAEKSAYISSVIRSTGLSDIFTSDLEDMPKESIQSVPAEASTGIPPKGPYQPGDEPITEKQKTLLYSLIAEKIYNPREREKWLQEAESCSKYDASELISSFLMPAHR
jgi:hypothetical protein